VGRKISDVGDGGTPDYRREWQVAFRPRRLEMLRLSKVFGDVISIGSGQLYVTNSDFSSNGSVLSAVFVLLQFFPSQRVL
jgi:hypothetical protein